MSEIFLFSHNLHQKYFFSTTFVEHYVFVGQSYLARLHRELYFWDDDGPVLLIKNSKYRVWKAVNAFYAKC